MIVISRLQTEVLCRGSPAYQVVASPTRLISVAQSVYFVSNMLSTLYVDPSGANWDVTAIADQIAMEQMTKSAADTTHSPQLTNNTHSCLTQSVLYQLCVCVSGEVDIAVFVPENVDQAMLQLVKDSGEYLILPAYLVANDWMYNNEIAAGVNIAGHALRMDVQTIGLIWNSCILYLNDPLVIAQNPWLLPLIGDMATNPVPIQSIVGCGSSVATAPIAASLNNLINRYLASNNDPLLASCVANYSLSTTNVVGGATSWADSANRCMSVLYVHCTRRCHGTLAAIHSPALTAAIAWLVVAVCDV